MKIWHAGYEDGSQTIVLGAIVDEAVAQLSNRNPVMRKYLADLKVEIVATDIGHKLSRKDRTIQFDTDTFPVNSKGPILLSEIGRDETAAASCRCKTT